MGQDLQALARTQPWDAPWAGCYFDVAQPSDNISYRESSVNLLGKAQQSEHAGLRKQPVEAEHHSTLLYGLCGQHKPRHQRKTYVYIVAVHFRRAQSLGIAAWTV